MATEHFEKTGADVSAKVIIARGIAHSRAAALTGPEAKQILRVPRLDGVHGTQLDAHNGALRAERHGG
jgi:hypothetical protein